MGFEHVPQNSERDLYVELSAAILSFTEALGRHAARMPAEHAVSALSDVQEIEAALRHKEPHAFQESCGKLERIKYNFGFADLGDVVAANELNTAKDLIVDCAQVAWGRRSQPVERKAA